MPFDKSLYPNCTEGAFGRPMRDSVAKAIDAILAENTLAKSMGLCKLASIDVPQFVAGERAEVSVIAADVVDRDREVVVPKGLDATHFLKNPIVQYGHDFNRLPVGKAQWVALRGHQQKAKTIYAPKPEDHPSSATWFPDDVYSLVKGGFLPGKSIGFLPLEGSPPTKDEPQYKGASFVFRKAVLLEYSVVNVPANQEAIVEAFAKGTLTIPAELAEDFHEAVVAAEKLKAEGKTPEPHADPTIAQLLAQYDAMKALRHADRLEVLGLRKEVRRMKRFIVRNPPAAPAAPMPSVKVYNVPQPTEAIGAAVAAALAGLDVAQLVDQNLARRLGTP